jgi:hypothetical protein
VGSQGRTSISSKLESVSTLYLSLGYDLIHFVDELMQMIRLDAHLYATELIVVKQLFDLVPLFALQVLIIKAYRNLYRFFEALGFWE